jgi:hypothetical protein
MPNPKEASWTTSGRAEATGPAREVLRTTAVVAAWESFGAQ